MHRDDVESPRGGGLHDAAGAGQASGEVRVVAVVVLVVQRMVVVVEVDDQSGPHGTGRVEAGAGTHAGGVGEGEGGAVPREAARPPVCPRAGAVRYNKSIHKLTATMIWVCAGVESLCVRPRRHRAAG